jgi:hypothetical protein
MPTRTVTIPVITNGEPENYNVEVPETVIPVEGDSLDTMGVAVLVKNLGNMPSVISFSNDQYFNCTKHGTGLYGKVGTTPFISGSQLAPGATLEIGTAVKLADAGPGEKVQGSVAITVSDDHVQA